jgi:hypothetical protein
MLPAFMSLQAHSRNKICAIFVQKTGRNRPKQAEKDQNKKAQKPNDIRYINDYGHLENIATSVRSAEL